VAKRRVVQSRENSARLRPMNAQAKNHWAAVRAAFAADAKTREDDAAAMTAEQRVLIGLEMGAAAPRTLETELELERLGLAQAELHFRYDRLKAKRASSAR
jgi:hypothetical protein